MKYSKQRDALLTLLKSTRSHPSADWLYTELKKEFPNISLGTVYRNLALLADNGSILKIATSSQKEHFDGFTNPHYHFVCNACDSIYDVELDNTGFLDKSVEQELGAEVDSHSLVFYGVCSKCKKRD
ncbi:MAG: transcriptional repressor [Clostridia bacterium]|jgi:Fur family peroxide stress response transcriptional regulator|nr:transcriptional repressor [Clostridia bacterium]